MLRGLRTLRRCLNSFRQPNELDGACHRQASHAWPRLQPKNLAVELALVPEHQTCQQLRQLPGSRRKPRKRGSWWVEAPTGCVAEGLRLECWSQWFALLKMRWKLIVTVQGAQPHRLGWSRWPLAASCLETIQVAED